jgi:hypothetical protein
VARIGLKIAIDEAIRTLKALIQRNWALFVMLMIGIIAVLGVVNPPWYQRYQSLLWAVAVLLTIALWIIRKQTED